MSRAGGPGASRLARVALAPVAGGLVGCSLPPFGPWYLAPIGLGTLGSAGYLPELRIYFCPSASSMPDDFATNPVLYGLHYDASDPGLWEGGMTTLAYSFALFGNKTRFPVSC